MRKIARTALTLAVAISLPSLLVACLGLGNPLPISVGMATFYNFFMIAFYGWPIYLPFALLHARLLKRYAESNWLTSTVIGGLLASAIVVLFTSSFTPAEIELNKINDSQLLTILIFGNGGSLYGLLYQRWVVVEA
jgi:hypothetical protein